MRTLELSKFTATTALVALRERREHAKVMLDRLDRGESDDCPDTFNGKDRIAYWRDVIRATNEAIEEIRNAWNAS